jgi:hypothetical protein
MMISPLAPSTPIVRCKVREMSHHLVQQLMGGEDLGGGGSGARAQSISCSNSTLHRQRYKVLLGLYTACDAASRQALVEGALLPR